MWNPMDREAALAIVGWRYPAPYDLYNMDGEEAVQELCEGCYFAWSEDGETTGFCCFGADARIPTVEENPYTEDHLDVGLGRHPALCGRGTGLAFLEDVMTLAGNKAGNRPLRLTVAKWNERARHLYRKAGFQPVGTVTHCFSKAGFLIMEKK